MDYIVDLHTHSNITDGSCTPKELIDVAVKEKVKAIALTDHDNIGGLEEAAKYAKEKNIDFLKGIEISALYRDGRIIHILGIGIDPTNGVFSNAYRVMKEARQEGVKHLLSEIKKQGVDIPIEELKDKALGEYLDRYDIFRYFTRNKMYTTAQGIWDKYLDPVPYGDKELIKVEDAIKIIKEARGLSFLAHYNKTMGFAGLNAQEMEKEISYLVSLGLDGVERYYPTFNEEDHKYLDYLIEKYNLMCSGGADYHGSNRPEIKLGRGLNNNISTSYKLYEKIIAKLSS